MGPMITYHDTVALQFPIKSPHEETMTNEVGNLDLQQPKNDVVEAIYSEMVMLEFKK